jgi:hypothetical protein
MTGQLPIFLSPDAARLLEWARTTADYRNDSSQVARPEQVPRITIRPGRLYEPWYLAGQFSTRQVVDHFAWSRERAAIARRELFGNGLVRELGYFRHEVTELGYQIAIEPSVVAVTYLRSIPAACKSSTNSVIERLR